MTNTPQSAELAGKIAEIWTAADEKLDRALMEVRGAVADISKGRAALSHTDPVSREQIAEEKLLSDRAVEMQSMIGAVAKAKQRASIHRVAYGKLAVQRGEFAAALDEFKEVPL